eukprot:c11481_g1_i2.p1 GENE.c11481_g1_i2~~c11481_g1_i2.p1  ORF type:complete len:166 (+),score=63.40 c11481_g1_i2:28-498(+)
MQVMAYCENDIDCRRVLIMSYFGERFKQSDCKRYCDNCCRTANFQFEERDMSDYARTVIRAVNSAYMKQVTLNMITDMLKGSKAKAMSSHGLTELSEYGVLKDMPKVDIDRIIKQLIWDHYIDEKIEISFHGSIVSFLSPGNRVPPNNTFLTLKFA